MAERRHADPPRGGTVKYIDSLLPSLVPSEQRVARDIVEHPDEVAMMSAADLAARNQTSAATVIRACQSLGFKGFQQLRLLLLRDLPTHRRPDVAVGEGAPSEWLPSLFRSAGEDLGQALAPLDYDGFDRAVAVLASARRLLIVGNGGSAPVAQMAALGFLSMGRPNEAPADAVLQQLTAASLRPGDVCVCISTSGSNGVTLRSAEAASATGATVVSVTGHQRSRIEELSDVTLVCRSAMLSWADGPIAADLSQFVLFTALQIAVTAATGGTGGDPAVLDEVMEVIEDELPLT